MRGPLQFSGLQPSFLEYKYVKALFDYGRVHDVLLRTSPDHLSFNHGAGDLEELRVAADDLLADLAACWDELVDDLCRREGIIAIKRQVQLRELRSRKPEVGARIDAAWTDLFEAINDARNEYQHEGYWKNVLGIGQGGGPFAIDLRTATGTGPANIFVLADGRRALRLLLTLNEQLGLGRPLPNFEDRCPECLTE